MENTNTEEIKMNAQDFIDMYQKKPEEVKKQYNGKTIILKGEITKAVYGITDWIVLNKKISCSINDRVEEKTVKECLKSNEDELRYAAPGNKNILVRGQISFGLFNTIVMGKCDLFYDEKTPYVQDIDQALENAKKRVSKYKLAIYICLAIASIAFVLPLVLATGFIPISSIFMLFTFIALGLLIAYPKYYTKRDRFFLAAVGNLLATGAKELNIPTLIGSTGAKLFFPDKILITQTYKGSVSPTNWKNVNLDKTTKKYLNAHNLLGNSFLGFLFQAFLFAFFAVIGLILPYFISFPEPDFIENFGEIMIFYPFYILIVLDSILAIKEKSLFLKYAENIAKSQKQWTINK